MTIREPSVLDRVMNPREPQTGRARLVRILACVLILAALASLIATFVLDDKTLRIATSLFSSLCAFALSWAVWPRKPASR